MHHVPYTHVLHSGKTVIQHIYDSHYEGAQAAEEYVRAWSRSRAGSTRSATGEVLAPLEYQAGAAQVWRDAVASWFLKTSGIPDAHGRVGHYPGRIEAEAMKLDGYAPKRVIHFETASGETAVRCPAARCSASFRHEGAPGWYALKVRYFDYAQSAARFRLWVGGQLVDEWVADDSLPTRRTEPDGTSSTRRVVSGIALRPGDEIRVEGLPDASEDAALDYVEVLME